MPQFLRDALGVLMHHPVRCVLDLAQPQAVHPVGQALQGLFFIKRHARLRARSTLYSYKEGCPSGRVLKRLCTQ